MRVLKGERTAQLCLLQFPKTDTWINCYARMHFASYRTKPTNFHHLLSTLSGEMYKKTLNNFIYNLVIIALETFALAY